MNVAIADVNTGIERKQNGKAVVVFSEPKAVEVEEHSATGISLGIKKRTAYGLLDGAYIFNPDFIVKNVKEHQAY